MRPPGGGVCTLWLGAVPPPSRGLFVLSWARPVHGRYRPQQHSPIRESGRRSYRFPGAAVHQVSSAVIEPRPTPLSTENFPQIARKHKSFLENGLGVYCESSALDFRLIFASGEGCLPGSGGSSGGRTTAWGGRGSTPSTFRVKVYAKFCTVSDRRTVSGRVVEVVPFGFGLRVWEL